MNCGVYKIINLKNNKFYIGSSNNLHKRFIHHKNSLLKNKHHNKYLQNAWNKYGEENFKFEIVEYCYNNFEKEQYYLDSLKPQYNIAKHVENCNKDRKLSKEHKEKIGKANSKYKRSKKLKKLWSKIKKDNPNLEHYSLIVQKAKEINSIKVKVYDLSMNFIKEYNSLSEAALDIKGDISAIAKVCKGKLKTHKNLIFKY